MFEREHHRRIALVLQALDPAVLLAHHCLFGGGTAMALRYGEYRESVDIDFVVADAAGYRSLRQLLGGPGGLAPLLRPALSLELAREVRTDQYGIRTVVRTEGVGIKFEIVREARIALDAPGPQDVVCGVATLAPVDLAACKLLANADRWGDDSVFSRDLIDLAMMAPSSTLLGQAFAKAQEAYGTAVRDSLAKAVEALRRRQQRLDECMRALHMQGVSRAALWQRIRDLERRAR
ncbi:hypothetical protein EZ313_12950 [Ramlibacter henchirensis]|uniref:Nucleotidyl transferase AbiEii/AbiGii toxin family protein n=1 Tax=Ramlibacter henchirensis TaxID=204072 RepID=A0A4Z0BTK2_9BURK|nr:nucleotidyl transferase AbiEii/AbiGii toxin family protein [Ramlibacter henchirensis]TFZ02181.1 hypothetical protein EZ313_12950 [Ramlibacter henchirensis]